MPPRPKALIIAFIGILLCSFVSACGYKDDLYLPDTKKAEDSKRKKKSDSPEAATAQPRE